MRDGMLLDTHMTTQPVPTAKIDRLMSAPRRNMPPMLRTLVNAIEGARKDGETRYVGCTYQRYFIERTVDSVTEQHVEYVVTANGVEEKV